MMTKGKMTWETLPEQEKNRVLQMMAPSKMIALNAKNTLTQKQQDTILANFWMQKGVSQVEITDAEVKKRYEKIKKMAKKSKGKKRLPDYAELEKSLKMQLAQEKFVDSLIKEAKIKLK
jgi:TRAP-type C4-dicarboxylate transport system substrate-binding protein